METIYSKIKNPVDNFSEMKKIFEYYSRSKSRSEFNDLLISRAPKEYSEEEKYKEDEFYAFMFNKWKNKLLSYKAPLFKLSSEIDMYDMLKGYFARIPDLHNREKIDKYMNLSSPRLHRIEYSNLLSKGIASTRWDREGRYSKWIHASLDKINFNNKVMPRNQHILYPSVNKDKTFEFAMAFIEECENNKLPYDIRINNKENRDDFFQLSVNKSYLQQYRELLANFIKKYPDYIDQNKRVLLTGEFLPGIGYGTDPEMYELTTHKSYLEQRGHVIIDVINKSTVDWIKSHEKKTVNYEGMKLPLKDFLSFKIKDRYIERINEYYNSLSDEDKSKRKYNLETFKNPQFVANTYNRILRTFDDYLSEVEKQYDEAQNPKSLNYNISDFMGIFKELSMSLFENDVNYYKAFKDNIKEISKKVDIDADNFSIDKEVYENIGFGDMIFDQWRDEEEMQLK